MSRRKTIRDKFHRFRAGCSPEKSSLWPFCEILKNFLAQIFWSHFSMVLLDEKTIWDWMRNLCDFFDLLSDGEKTWDENSWKQPRRESHVRYFYFFVCKSNVFEDFIWVTKCSQILKETFLKDPPADSGRLNFISNSCQSTSNRSFGSIFAVFLQTWWSRTTNRCTIWSKCRKQTIQPLPCTKAPSRR